MTDAHRPIVTLESLAPLPTRPPDAHKGTFGTVIVVGGCRTMIGAPALCARAAIRGGAGLVKIAALPAILPHALTIEPAATGIALDIEHDPLAALAMIDDADPDARAILAVGPGWGQARHNRQLLTLLLAGPRPVILDADALNLLAADWPKTPASANRPASPAPRVFTPHPGEFRRLAQAVGLHADPIDQAARPTAAADLCMRLDADVLLLKGRHTVVTDGRRVYINHTGNPALATAGSGDVLTGLIAALLAQGLPAFDAAALGTHLHGMAADQWAQRHGPAGLHALDLADALPDACRLYPDASPT
jgi:NAD(P)H-hydrate epimerase